MVWPVNKPASGIPAGGPGLHGDKRGGPGKEFSTDNQPAPDLKAAGHAVRAEFRRKLALKLDKIDAVYERALDNPDERVGLVAAKQISVELWGQPTQPLSGDDDKGPLVVVIRRFTDDVPEPDA